MTPQNTPEHRAIEKAAETHISKGIYADSGGANMLSVVEQQVIKAYRAGALSPEAKAFHQRWIPVTERLPDTDREVLIINSAVVKMIAFCIDGVFFTPTGEKRGVTHWQEMPLAP